MTAWADIINGVRPRVESVPPPLGNRQDPRHESEPDMSRSFRAVAAVGLIVASGGYFDTVAHGQGAVAFQPSIGFVPNGATMTATPVVTPDRRYVRLTVNPFFNTVNGFTTYSSPLGAVGGTGFGGFGGMNGVNAGGGTGMGPGGPMGPGSPLLTGYGLAGPLPPPAAVAGDPFNTNAPGGLGGGAAPGTPFGMNAGMGAQAGAAGPVGRDAEMGAPTGAAGPWLGNPSALAGFDAGGLAQATRLVRGPRPTARKAARRPAPTSRRRAGTTAAAPSKTRK